MAPRLDRRGRRRARQGACRLGKVDHRRADRGPLGEPVVRLRPQSLDIDDLRDVIATAPNPATLLIDDAHLFDTDDAHRIAAIIDRAPSLRTIIAGRHLGPFETLAARADARVITGPQLMFTREEIGT